MPTPCLSAVAVMCVHVCGRARRHQAWPPAAQPERGRGHKTKGPCPLACVHAPAPLPCERPLSIPRAARAQCWAVEGDLDRLVRTGARRTGAGRRSNLLAGRRCNLLERRLGLLGGRSSPIRTPCAGRGAGRAGRLDDGKEAVFARCLLPTRACARARGARQGDCNAAQCQRHCRR